MENGIKLDADDDHELVNFCQQEWNEERNKNLRSIQKLTKKISIAFKNYLIDRYSRGKDDSKEEKSILEYKVKEMEPEITNKIINFFIERQIKKYQRGLTKISDQKEKDVGIVLVLSCDQEFYDTYSLKKEPIEDISVNMDLNEELPKEEENKWIILIEYLREKKDITAKFIQIIKKALSLDKYNKVFFNRYIESYIIEKAKIFKEKEPKKTQFYLQNYHLLKFKEKNPFYSYIDCLYDKFGYFIWKYEDFIINFISLVKFFTGLKISMKVEPNLKIFLYFSGTEKNLRCLAEAFEYELQIKNYGLKYLEISKEISKANLQDSEDSDNLLEDNNKETLQFHKLDHNNQSHFPPYAIYGKDLNIKFRRYSKNDLYHDCPNDPEFSNNSESLYNLVLSKNLENEKCCSNFRNIDKIRLMYRVFDELVVMKKLREDHLDSVIILRNYETYKELLGNDKIIWGLLNIFDSQKQLEFIQTVRNFYGERISFYFLFFYHFTLWLTFPCFLGIIVYICNFLSNKILDYKIDFLLSIMDLIYITYAILIIIWANLLLKTWKQKEKFYSYLWGTENFEIEEPIDDSFEFDNIITFLFNFKIRKQSQIKKIFKFIISYIIVTLFCLSVIAIILSMFKWKSNIIKYNNAHGIVNSNNLPMYIGIMNGLQIKIMSFIYWYIANWLTKWENHEKNSTFDYNLSIKIIIFEFINNYSSLYYIAFVKAYFEGCEQGNCLIELRFQIYLIFLISFLFNLIEIGKPFVTNYLNKKSYLKEYNGSDEIDFTVHGIHHQRISEEISTLRDDYNEIVILFGYITFFSVAAPVTPFICFILIYIEKYVDAFKFFNLHRVYMIDQANGIGVYYTLFKIWCFLGMTTNIGLILFTNSSLLNVSISKRFFIFFVVENIILIFNYLINWKILPSWFENKKVIQSLYNKNYLNKDSEGLPHHDLYEKVTLQKYKTRTTFKKQGCC